MNAAGLASATPKTQEKKMLPTDTDPTTIGLTKDGVVRLCDESLNKAGALLGDLVALDGGPDDKLTYAAVLGKFDELNLAIRNASDFPALISVAHPDAAVREAAKGCEPKVDKFATEIFLNAKLARVLSRYAKLKPTLAGDQQRLLDHTLRDFRRNGLELDEKGQARLRELNETLTRESQDFETNLAESTLSLMVDPKDMEGLPQGYVDGHKPGADGKVKITTDYPDYFPFMQYAKNRKVAFELYKLFDNRAADKNVKVLEKLLALRKEKAKLLGYPTWADYVLEPRMAKSSQTVATFLEDLRVFVKARAAEEMTEFHRMHEKLGGKKGEPLTFADRSYLEDRLRQEKYGLDSKEVSQYFEIGRVRQGLLDITSELFGISYEVLPADVAPRWHPDVEALRVKDTATGKEIGRFFFDLYPREGKYKHAAVFSIRPTKKMADGSRLVPIASIVCNFPKPGGASPALMSHQDVVTFFHEFGHVLHHLLSTAELSSYAGTAVERDFVEAPSQMLEEWAWSKDSLAKFARHHQTGAPLPDTLHAAMTRARTFGVSLATSRQLFLAALDQTYHTREPGFDTTQVLAEVQSAYVPFKYVDGTHFQATFGHLVGYDAGYYGYQWALSLAQDLFTRFKKNGMFDKKTATEYRDFVLAPGGSDDGDKLVAHFLGRPPTREAYKAFLANH
jgi:thimet oligopeptidase